MKSQQTVLLKVFSEKKKRFKKTDCNVSGVVKLALTGANTQKNISGHFWYVCYSITKIFFKKKGKNCRTCVSWLCISYQPFSVGLHSYPSRHTLLPKEQAAISLSPVLLEWSKEERVRKRSRWKDCPAALEHKDVSPTYPPAAAGATGSSFCSLLSPVGERSYLNPH